jgi:Arc/MetJ-type ribon-helix-helix transcriptional regulator
LFAAADHVGLWTQSSCHRSTCYPFQIDAAAEAVLDTRFLESYPYHMEINLTPDQKAFVRQAIESGRLLREEDAVKEALSLWEERERTRAEILVAVDEAEASLVHGDGRIITQKSMRELAEDVKRRGRARLAGEQQPPR